jgi:hypothetical protein
MVMRPTSPPLDPAADAAALLRRLGFAILVLGVPVAALMMRRATVIFVPIGVVLLVLAALLDGAGAGFAKRLKAAFQSQAGLAAGLAVAWAALSIAWTPFPDSAIEKIVNVLGMVAIAAAAVASLPERMRAANLYLVPIGVAVAVIVALALGLTVLRRYVGADAEGDSLERGLVILTVAVWPAVAWLVSRARPILALVLLVAVAAAVLGGGSRAAALALAVGAIVYGLGAWRQRLSIAVTATIMAAALVLAPIVPFLVRPFLKYFGGPLYPGATALRVWSEVMSSAPIKLITGYGLDTSLRSRFTGQLPVTAPQALPFEIWYELGLVGALAAAAALFFATRSLATNNQVLVPGQLAAFAAAFALASTGAASAQAWWLTALAAVLVTFVAIERGQFRTSRPKATLFGRPKADPGPAPRSH